MKIATCPRSNVWWPLKDIHIEESNNSHKSCQLHKTTSAKTLIHQWETSETLWIRIHVDFAWPFLDKILLILYDSYSGWIKVHLMSNIISNATINNLLRYLFATHGLTHIIQWCNLTLTRGFGQSKSVWRWVKFPKHVCLVTQLAKQLLEK